MLLSGNTKSRICRLAILAVSGLVPAIAWAVCTCGFGDGRFTLVSINVNGNMNDWAPVHADLDNNVCDGPANGLTDRDAHVRAATLSTLQKRADKTMIPALIDHLELQNITFVIRKPE